MQAGIYDIDKIGTDTYEVSPVPSCYSSDDDFDSHVEVFDKPEVLSDEPVFSTPTIIPSRRFVCLKGVAKKDQEYKLISGECMLYDIFPDNWIHAMGEKKTINTLHSIGKRLVESLQKDCVFPDPANYFRAFQTAPSTIRVVIIGQDPYHIPGKAHGLSFSDNSGDVARSLANIINVVQKNGYKCVLKERKDGKPIGNLEPWADQGVMLLNTCLTVVKGNAGSHLSIGWQEFTDDVIRTIASGDHPIVFCLWGVPAQKKEAIIIRSSNNKDVKHLVLKTSHPSPFSFTRGFNTCTHFKDSNDFLVSHGYSPINWSI